MDKQGIDTVVELANKATKIEVSGKSFIHEDFNEVQPHRVASVNTSTLSSIIDYVKSNPDKLDLKDLILHITDYNEVRLFSKINSNDYSRSIHLISSAGIKPVLRFDDSEDNLMPIEKFIIAMITTFQDSTVKSKIMSYLSSLKDVNEMVFEDDGITQKVTASSGVSSALTSTERINPIVKLIPNRTFNEIAQVESTFLLRLKSINGNIRARLIESNDEKWKIEAKLNIKKYFDGKIPADVTILC